MKYAACLVWFWVARAVHFLYLGVEIPVIAAGRWLKKRLESAELGVLMSRLEAKIAAKRRMNQKGRA